MSFGFGGTSTVAATTKPAFGFGSVATAPSISSAPASSAGFSFGAAPPTSAAKPVATISSGIPFGAAAAASAAPTGFGTTVATPSFGGLGIASSTPASSTAFGGFSQPLLTMGTQPVSSATAAPLAFGPGFGQQTSLATTKPGFGLAAPAASFTSVATTSGFPSLGGFGLQPSTAAVNTMTGSSFGAGGLGGTALPTTAPSSGLGGTLFAAGAASLGLPATTNSASQGVLLVPGSGMKFGKDDSWKDANIPPEMTQDVDSFRKFVKDQKGVSTDLSHLSLPKLHQQIQSDIHGLNAVVKELGSGVAKQKTQLERLKKECAKELANVELAQRTKDTPAALQYENNNAPIDYFNRLLANFEAQMASYKRQIEDVENYLQTISSSGSSSPETLIKALQKTQAAFVSLAGRYQPLHEAIQQQKSLYVRQLRKKHGITEDPFRGSGSSTTSKSFNSTLGPSPFSGRPDPLSTARAAQQTLTAQAAAQVSSLAGPPSLGLAANTSSFGFGNATGFGTGSSFGNVSKPSAATVGFGSFAQRPATAQVLPSSTQNTSAFNFNTGAAASPGLLGSALSPFGTPAQQQGQQQPSLFQTGGKRVKH